MTKSIAALLLNVLILSGLFGSAQAATNVVAKYLSHADQQYEDGQQKSEIIRALKDMRDTPVTVLRTRKYKDYEGREGAWSLTTLIRRYFVPTSTLRGFDDESFYRDVKKRPAQDAVRAQLRTVQKRVMP